MKTRAGLLLSLGLTLAADAVLGQAPAGRAEFEVASVKPAAPTSGHFQYHMTMRIDAGRVVMSNASLIDLIRTAYRVKSFEVSGPDWMPTQRFDVVAKLPEGVTPEQVPEMLQTLLAARFKLATHGASKEQTGFALVAGKGGPKLKESQPGTDETRSGWTRTMGPDGTMHIEAKKMTMPALADLVATFLDYPVRDMTELKGIYDVAMDFSPEDLRNGSKASGLIPAGPPAGDSDSSESSVYASLRKLGLNLDRRKLAVESIVVDHVEKVPTGN